MVRFGLVSTLSAGRMAYRFPFTPFPRGWFRIAPDAVLSPGSVLAVHYFGRDLVLFRDMNGVPRLFDAHCAHLGAHLGHGGIIVDGHHPLSLSWLAVRRDGPLRQYPLHR